MEREVTVMQLQAKDGGWGRLLEAGKGEERVSRGNAGLPTP